MDTTWILLALAAGLAIVVGRDALSRPTQRKVVLLRVYYPLGETQTMDNLMRIGWIGSDIARGKYTVKVDGYAASDERDGYGLAQQRAMRIAELIRIAAKVRTGVRPVGSIPTNGFVVEAASPWVDVVLDRGEVPRWKALDTLGLQ